MVKNIFPYKITDKMLFYIASISEKIGQITGRNNLEAKPRLRRNNRIKSIHPSLRIEANSLSLDEVKDVINGKLVSGSSKEIQEVKNAMMLMKKYQKSHLLSLSLYILLMTATAGWRDFGIR